jgi:hypothetical protein
MTVRKYTSRSQQTTLSSAVTSGATVISVTNASTLLAGTTITAGQTFVVVIDPDTALEEIVEITSASSNNLTVTRAVDMSGALAQDHSSGAVVRHMIIGRDLRESNLHIEATGAYNDGTGTHAMHGLGSSDGVVVGTTANQTLTNKTLTAPILTGVGVDASIIFEGTTADAFETTLTVVDPTQDNTVTIPNTSGTVAILDATQTMSNKTLTSPIISGSPVITGLSSAGMSASSATPKDYVDSILGSATAAATSATSAAASATAAATSASSAATSASLAGTSASSASTSQTAAATSAASAATSVTAAATSATSAAASATAAATSATSATASATAAATSAASALTSETAAATSATSAAASATAAATSASSAATSASSAATSATDAATTYDNFDDRYLGSKSTAPTVDNDGNTLLVGAIYWNSTSNLMFVWSGSAWVQITTTGGYSAPTLGTTAIPSGATVTTINGLTLGLPSANNINLGYATTVTAAGTTTLTNTSAAQQFFTGTTTQTVVLPVVSTLVLGASYLINNNSSGTVTVNSSGGNNVVGIGGFQSVRLTCILTTGTTAASWDIDFVGFNSITGTGNPVLAQSPTISTPLINSISSTTNGSTVTLYDSQTNGTLSIGGSSTRTGTLTIANGSISSHTINIGNGTTGSGNTKAINIGLNGAAGSTTNIALGSTTGTSTVTVNGDINMTIAGGPGSLKDELTLLIMGAI